MIEQSDQEPASAYLKRCTAIGPEYGLVSGHRQLGLRVRRDPNSPVSRIWLLEGTPRDWTTDQVTHALASTFDSVQLMRQRRRRAQVDYFFKGSTKSQHDLIAIPVAIDQGEITLWARWAPPRANAPGQTIRTTGSWSLLPPKSQFQAAVPVLDDLQSPLKLPSPRLRPMKPLLPRPPPAKQSRPRKAQPQNGHVRSNAPSPKT